MRNALATFIVVLFLGCASTKEFAPDDRIDVDAALTGSSKPTSIISYRVTVRNNSDGMLTIKRVEVEPIGGAAVQPAYVASNKQIEPGETAVFSVWTEIDMRLQSSRGSEGVVMGVGSMARVHVTFLDGTSRVIASYLLDV